MKFFHRNITTTTSLFVKMMKYLGDEGRDEDGKRILGMYHSTLNTTTDTAVIHRFKEGRIRCLVSTIAFGMGINIPDIRHVFHYGPPTSIMEYWQDVGRCARDGLPGQATLLRVTVMGYRPDPTMKALLATCEAGRMCFRQGVLQELWPLQPVDEPAEADQCCSICSTRE